jgi:hypothetical protein
MVVRPSGLNLTRAKPNQWHSLSHVQPRKPTTYHESMTTTPLILQPGSFLPRLRLFVAHFILRLNVMCCLLVRLAVVGLATCTYSPRPQITLIVSQVQPFKPDRETIMEERHAVLSMHGSEPSRRRAMGHFCAYSKTWQPPHGTFASSRIVRVAS